MIVGKISLIRNKNHASSLLKLCPTTPPPFATHSLQDVDKIMTESEGATTKPENSSADAVSTDTSAAATATTTTDTAADASASSGKAK